MTKEKFEQAAQLIVRIDKMRSIETDLKTKKVTSLQLYTNLTWSFNIFSSNENGGAFVIEKMIEAGLLAAMTVRALAENDLEKL